MSMGVCDWSAAGVPLVVRLLPMLLLVCHNIPAFKIFPSKWGWLLGKHVLCRRRHDSCEIQ